MNDGNSINNGSGIITSHHRHPAPLALTAIQSIMQMKSHMQHCIFYVFFVAVTGCNTNPGKTKQERIGYIMEQAYKSQQFIGNVLIAESGHILYNNSFGKSDAEKDIKNDDSTKFLIASISKPVTAIIILRLVERGKIKLEDQIGRFFKIENAAVGKITVHQLLTHSSGLNEFINKEPNFDFKASLNKAVIKFQPGADFEYSNSGYVLLIKIAEQITGKNYEEIVKIEVFEPANMSQSGVAREGKTSIFAKGYKNALQKETTKIDFPFVNVDGAGSLYSTTGDLFKLDNALRKNSLLGENTKALMLTQHIPEKYAYGWFIRERGGVWDVYWCKGDLPGVTTFISRRIQKDQLIILLSNAENLNVSGIEKDIAQVLKASG